MWRPRRLPYPYYIVPWPFYTAASFRDIATGSQQLCYIERDHSKAVQLQGPHGTSLRPPLKKRTPRKRGIRVFSCIENGNWIRFVFRLRCVFCVLYSSFKGLQPITQILRIKKIKMFHNTIRPCVYLIRRYNNTKRVRLDTKLSIRL